MRSESPNRDEARRVVHRRAFANLVLALRDAAARSADRLSVRPWAPAALLLEYRDVRTLVTDRVSGLTIASRDFTVFIGCAPPWPFAREAPPQLLILTPADFRHPNGNGHSLCLDAAGLLPERIADVLYDNLRLRAFRLDHYVDGAATDYVRANLAAFPADTRPL